jgi:hypothetical protein
MPHAGGNGGLAVLVERVLGALAFQGGPHGRFGPWGWELQLPGLFIMFATPLGTWMRFRVILVVLAQTALWFGVLTLLMRLENRFHPT